MDRDRKRSEYITILLLGVITVAAFFIYYHHWTFELPNHPNVDEGITINNVKALINGKEIYSFNYPHLVFYYGYYCYKLVGAFIEISDLALFLRCCICGFALISNICIFFDIKKITNSNYWGIIGYALSVFSLYSFEYLFYCGPDVMLYGISNLVFLVGINIYYNQDEKLIFQKLYPLMAITIGLAVSAKYHGILLGIFWMCIHLSKKYYKSFKKNLCFLGNCFIILLFFLLVNYLGLLHIHSFIEGFLSNFQRYSSQDSNGVGVVYNLPIWGYTEPFFFSMFGVVGALFTITGIIYMLTGNRRKLGISFILPCVAVFFALCRYYIVLARNLSLIMPIAHILLILGIYAAYEWLKLKFSHPEYLVNVIVIGSLFANIFAVLNVISYDVSYDAAEQWINDNIEENATIYVEYSYSPIIDKNKYKVINVMNAVDPAEFDVSMMNSGDYYISVGYKSARYVQRKDYILWKGRYCQPDWAETYLNNMSKLTEIQSFEGITDGRGWQYIIDYLGCFRFPKSQYYQSTTIKIYRLE